MLTPSPNKSACLKVAREKLLQIDKQKWENALVSNGRNENNGNKLRTYSTYKNALCTEFYVKHNETESPTHSRPI